MHEKSFKIDFFANFRKLQKKLPIYKKKYTKILNAARAVVTSGEKKVKSRNRIFFGSAKVAPDCKPVIISPTVNFASESSRTILSSFSSKTKSSIESVFL